MRPAWIIPFVIVLIPLAQVRAQVLDSADTRAVAQLTAAFDETGSGRGAAGDVRP